MSREKNKAAGEHTDNVRNNVHRGRGPGPGAGMMPSEKASNFWGTAKRLLKFLRPFKVTLVLVFILAIIGVCAAIVAPKVLGEITNTIYDGVKGRIEDPNYLFDFARILRLMILLGCIYLINSVFTFLQYRMMVKVSQTTVYRLRKAVDEKLKNLPLKYFDANPRGEILSRVTNDVDNIASTLQETLNQMISAVVTVIGVLIMMLTISVALTLVAIGTLAVCMILTMLVAKRSQGYFSQQWKSTGRLNGHVEEVYTGHDVVKLFNKQQEEIDKFDQENGRLYKAGFRAQFISGVIMPLMRLINNLNYVVVCVLGAMKIISGDLRLGDVTAFISYSRQVSQPVQQTANIINTMQSTMASAERVFELLDEEDQVPDNSDPQYLRYPKGAVEFKDVCFRYTPDVPLIEHMNLSVRPGQTVAIVGPTGAGKTTLVNLLMRFYEIDSGSITIDGIDIRDLTRENLRRCIGMVLQDTWLFSGTIRENIGYGWVAEERGEVTGELVEAAAMEAYADKFIRTLSDGYDTQLTDDASNISQGQKQLLTIARAFLSDPSILILDEATSSVDTRTEMLIQKAMNQLMLGRTSFVIAHRLSTIRDADVIIVMNEGRIVEQGNHKELLEKGGFYAELYNSQFADAG